MPVLHLPPSRLVHSSLWPTLAQPMLYPQMPPSTPQPTAQNAHHGTLCLRLSYQPTPTYSPSIAPSSFTFQIQRISDTAKFAFTRIASPSLDDATLSMPDTESTWSDLKSRLQRTISLLEDHAGPAAFVGQEDKEIVLYGGKYKLTGESYLQTYAVPNFYFSVTVAYCLLRGKGVPVGKMDYLMGSAGMGGGQ